MDEDRHVARMWKISRTAHEMVRDRVNLCCTTTWYTAVTHMLALGLRSIKRRVNHDTPGICCKFCAEWGC